jgi:peptidoglycan/xylan/chitin deacetylase (PgdA/CDA1 family)
LITIVMYHYVRDLENTRYPRISAMRVQDFVGQLDYLQAHYSVVTAKQVIEAAKGEGQLPKNACLLTFDDGYLDHYLHVFPLIHQRGLTGSFYMPASVLGTGKVLQINKVHFVLAAIQDHGKLVKSILEKLPQFRRDFEIVGDKELFSTYSKMSRWDPPETAFVKKVLQNGLPGEVSTAIANDLFVEFAGVDEAVLACELYMNLPQLQTMLAAGMEVGGHGDTHRALGNLSYKDQEQEILATKAFLDKVHGRPNEDWILTYPSGSYNRDTVKILSQHGCALAMTTELGIAKPQEPLEMARLNANDLPYNGGPPNEWTRKVIEL